MPENDFEKQVKKTMEGFGLKPSEPVWNKIEAQLPRQDRRRRFIAFFFLFAGIIVCGYFFYNKWTKEGKAEHSISQTDNANQPTKQQADNIAQNKTNDSAIAITPQPETIATTPVNTKKENTETVIKANTTAVATNEKPQQQFISSQKFYKEEKRDNVLPALSDSINTEIKKQPVIPNNAQVENTVDNKNKNLSDEKNNTISSDSLIIDKATPSLAAADSIQNKLLKDSSETAIAKTKKQSIKLTNTKKWQWGISALYGRSDIVESLLGTSQNKSLSYDYVPGFPATGELQQSSYTPSKEIKAKAAFSIGVNFKKPLSKKSSFITGLQYTKYNTSIETGNVKDSTIVFTYGNLNSAPQTSLSRFYASGAGVQHINSYQLLQLPLIYEQRFTKSNRLTLNWNAGLSITQLLSNNALILDYTNQAFYHNNAFYRKTQVDVLAGFNVQFATGKKAIMNVGPQLQYSLSNLLKSSDYGNQHFINYGIKAGIFFRK